MAAKVVESHKMFCSQGNGRLIFKDALPGHLHNLQESIREQEKQIEEEKRKQEEAKYLMKKTMIQKEAKLEEVRWQNEVREKKRSHELETKKRENNRKMAHAILGTFNDHKDALKALRIMGLYSRSL